MSGLFSWMRTNKPDIAIDLGTANTRVVARGAGVIFEHPSICCFTNDGMRPRLIAVGAPVRDMVDRTPPHLVVRHALARGVLQDFVAASELLKFAVVASTGGRRFGRPSAIIGVPEDATKAECIALRQAADDAGLNEVSLVREPFAAALGAWLPVREPCGSMIVECGAGTTEVAIIASGKVCSTGSVRRGGGTLDAAIADYLREHHKFLIGAITAENLKLELLRSGSDIAKEERRNLEIRGRSLQTGRPSTLALNFDEFQSVLENHARQIVNVVRLLLHETSPELIQDIHDHGIVLTGGSSDSFIADMITCETGVHAKIADMPHRCVMQGLGILLEA